MEETDEVRREEMDRRIRWFDMETPKEKAKREKQYFQTMFPLGEEQQKQEKILLKELLPRIRPEEAMYQLLQAKEAFASADGEEELSEALAEWRRSPLAKVMSGRELDLIQALARLLQSCRSMEEFPSAEDVRKDAN